MAYQNWKGGALLQSCVQTCSCRIEVDMVLLTPASIATNDAEKNLYTRFSSKMVYSILMASRGCSLLLQTYFDFMLLVGDFNRSRI